MMRLALSFVFMLISNECSRSVSKITNNTKVNFHLFKSGKGAFKYYISRFSQILDPPPPLNKQNKHGLRPPTPP